MPSWAMITYTGAALQLIGEISNMNIYTYIRAGFVAVLCGALCAAVPLPSAAQEASAPVSGLSVHGNHLVADGQVFMVKGVQIVGRLVPGQVIDTVNPTYKDAYLHYGKAELVAARAFGANTVRFQISQIGIDPESVEPIDHAAYLQEVRSAVDLALGQGFAVIVSLQHQGGSGADYDQALPGENTVRAWKVLAPFWKDDKRVLYEIYNEPAVSADSKDGSIRDDNWKLWKDGGDWVTKKARKNMNGAMVESW